MNFATAPSFPYAAAKVHRSLVLDAARVIETLVDGSKVQTDECGHIVFISFANGSAVKRQENFSLIQGADMSLWFHGEENTIYPLD